MTKREKLSLSILYILVVFVFNRHIEHTFQAHNTLQYISDKSSTLIQVTIGLYLINYKSIKFNIYHIELIIGALLGIAFFNKFIGLDIVNPTNIDWIMSGGDRTQHFLGWSFYFHDSWRIPLGYFSNWASPNGMSLLFTDSIPIFGIFFKLFKSVLPSIFQYLGLWLLLCYIIMGLISMKIFSILSDDIRIQTLGSILMIISPIMFYRTGFHTSLSSHWLLIVALYLIMKDEFNAKYLIYWILLLSVSVMIHPYFLFMLYVMFLFQFLRLFILNKEIKIKEFIVSISSASFSVIIIMYLLGYFKVNADPALGGLGFYNFNLNSFWNPMSTSSVLKNLDFATVGQYEGYNYLGLGIFILICLVIYSIIQQGVNFDDKRFYITVLSILILSLIIAISPSVTYGKRLLINFNPPQAIGNLWSIVRASGRMAWPAYYIIVIVILSYFIKNNKKGTLAILAIICLIQFYDFKDFYMSYRKTFYSYSEWVNPLKDEFWSEAKNKYKNLSYTSQDNAGYEPLAFYASMNYLSMDNGYFARIPKSLKSNSELNIQKLLSGNYDANTIYIINIAEKDKLKITYDKDKDLYKEIDGYLVIAPNWYKINNK